MRERDALSRSGAPTQEAATAPDVGLLYRDHAPRLRRRLRAEVRSAEEANDLLHEAFARLLGTSSLRVLRDPAAFLNRIVRNLLIDRSRRLTTRTPHVPIGDEYEIAVPPTQGEDIELGEMRQRYRELVELLPPRTREVFRMHRRDELSYKEIAARLDISIRTVEWHVAQAIVRLAEGLDRE